MSLSSAMVSAQSTFNNVGTQTDVTSKNIANVGNANYVKRTAILSTTMYGATVITTGRSQDESLFRQTISTSSLFTGQTTLLDGLTDIKSIYGGNDYESAPATYLSEMLKSLQSYAAKPDDAALAATVVSSAQDVATAIKTSADSIQKMRVDIDKSLTIKVDELNELLAKFETANNAVKNNTALGRDASDAYDTRDTLLKQISEIVGVTAVVRPDNDLALYTTQGTTLFETVARKVSFTSIGAYDAATTGNPVTIDAVKVAAGSGGNTTASGSIAALLQMRDDVIPVMQSQLDELARAVITAFSESDVATVPPATPGPDLPGLFTWNGAIDTSTVPATANPIPTTYTPGLANLLQVNKEVIIVEGGDPKKIRDGGINGADYVRNGPPASAGYSALINEYADAFSIDMDFDTATQIEPKSSLLEYATNSMGWFEQVRTAAINADETKSAMYQRSNEAYSNTTGVSLDEELSLLLDIEQSYKAAAKLVSTVDEMLNALLNMVR